MTDQSSPQFECIMCQWTGTDPAYFLECPDIAACPDMATPPWSTHKTTPITVHRCPRCNAKVFLTKESQEKAEALALQLKNEVTPMTDKSRNRTMIIASIERQWDRVLLHAKKSPIFPDYYVMASLAEAADLEVGQTIEYEPCGVNFGWFVKACSADCQEKGRDHPKTPELPPGRYKVIVDSVSDDDDGTLTQTCTIADQFHTGEKVVIQTKGHVKRNQNTANTDETRESAKWRTTTLGDLVDSASSSGYTFKGRDVNSGRCFKIALTWIEDEPHL